MKLTNTLASQKTFLKWWKIYIMETGKLNVCYGLRIVQGNLSEVEKAWIVAFVIGTPSVEWINRCKKERLMGWVADARGWYHI